MSTQKSDRRFSPALFVLYTSRYTYLWIWGNPRPGLIMNARMCDVKHIFLNNICKLSGFSFCLPTQNENQRRRAGTSVWKYISLNYFDKIIIYCNTRHETRQVWITQARKFNHLHKHIHTYNYYYYYTFVFGFSKRGRFKKTTSCTRCKQKY